MAGMPKSIVKRANEILRQLEQDNQGIAGAPTGGIQAKPMEGLGETRGGMQLSFFQLDDPVLSQIRDELKKLDIDNMPPLEALNKLNHLRRIVMGK
jgi:DNA mismatch repair protein MutS